MTTARKERTAATVSQEPKLPYANEATRKHMLDEASQELAGTESHQPLLVAASVIFAAKGDLVTLVSDDPMVADGNAMSVAAEITEDCPRAVEGERVAGQSLLESQHRRV